MLMLVMLLCELCVRRAVMGGQTLPDGRILAYVADV